MKLQSLGFQTTSESRANVNDKGIHILGDFYDVQNGFDEMLNADLLEKFCEQKVEAVGLTQVGKLFYQFPGSGVTGVILLAESHVAIHTWPEKGYLTLDIYVCNVSQDNTEKAKRIYQYFKEFFLPQRLNHQEVERE